MEIIMNTSTNTKRTESDQNRKLLTDIGQIEKNEAWTQDELQIQKIQKTITNTSNPEESSGAVDDPAVGITGSDEQYSPRAVLRQKLDVRNSNNSGSDVELNGPSNQFSSPTKVVDLKETFQLQSTNRKRKLDDSPIDQKSGTVPDQQLQGSPSHPEENHEPSKTPELTLKKCLICFKSFSRRCYLTNHLKTHNKKEGDTKPQPHECSSSVNSPRPSPKAEQTSDTIPRKFQCTICQKIFGATANLKLHMRTHTGEKPFKCTVCSKSFTQQHSLKTHLRIHTGERPYECSICGKSFAHHPNYKVHVRAHTEERRHNCFMCAKRYAVKSDLDAHLLTHDEN